MVMAVAAVISSVAVMSPYETKGGLLAADRNARAQFAAQANRECAASLPGYRSALAQGTDGPEITTAAGELDALRLRLGHIGTTRDLRGPVSEWLTTWQDYAYYERRYAMVIGPAVDQAGRLVPRRLSAADQSAALEERRLAAGTASLADTFAANQGVPACRIEPAVTS